MVISTLQMKVIKIPVYMLIEDLANLVLKKVKYTAELSMCSAHAAIKALIKSHTSVLLGN